MYAIGYFFDHYGTIFLNSVLGCLGAAMRVAIGHDRGEPQSLTKICTSLICGTILAGTSTPAIIEYLHLPAAFIPGTAFMIGLLGMGFVYQALDGKIPLPPLFKKEDLKS